MISIFYGIMGYIGVYILPQLFFYYVPLLLKFFLYKSMFKLN